MTRDEFDDAFRAFRRHRPFCPFSIELVSGARIPIVHPETVRREAKVHVARMPDGGYSVFTPESVARLHD